MMDYQIEKMLGLCSSPPDVSSHFAKPGLETYPITLQTPEDNQSRAHMPTDP